MWEENQLRLRQALEEAATLRELALRERAERHAARYRPHAAPRYAPYPSHRNVPLPVRLSQVQQGTQPIIDQVMIFN